MKCGILAVFMLGGAVLALAESSPGFLSTLSAEQRSRLGLDQLSKEQLALLDAAVDAYRGSGETKIAKEAAVAAVEEYKKTAEPVAIQQAAAEAVEEYKKTKEPSVVARALEALKRKHVEEQQEKTTAKLVGRFDGWDGQTLFRLDNGQVWRQAAPDVYDHKPAEDVAVVVYRSPSGYWRLRILDDKGAWVTVKRVN